MAEFILPATDDRTAVIGRTGSGKTQLALWLLSRMPIDRMPWVIVDYKGDELVNAIDRAIPISYDVVPIQPGVYILRVLPGEEEKLSEFKTPRVTVCTWSTLPMTSMATQLPMYN